VTVTPPASASEAARDLALIRGRLAEAPDSALLKPLGLGGIALGHGVVASVPALVAALCAGPWREIALLADTRAMAGGDGELKTSVARALEADGNSVRRVTIGDEDARVHADPSTLDAAVAGASGADVLVSVGSGTIVDIGKAVAARIDGLPHVAVQTAASVNGFADDQSVLLVNGVKRTTATAWPDRLVIDTDVIAQAPTELNRAGLGDLLASYTAPADWLLASLVEQDDSYSSVVVALAREHVDSAVAAATGIGRGDPAALETLVGALTLSGIAMGVAGRTSPGSGMEHTVSHLLEMSEAAVGREALHGAKVGPLSVLSALLWEKVRATARSGRLRNLRFPDAAEMHRRIEHAFGELDGSAATVAECWHDYSRKLERWHAAAPRLQTLEERWDAFEAEVSPILTPASRLVEALRAAGAPVRLSELGIDGGRLRWAIENCHLMRDRFTIADFAFFLGMFDRDDVEALLEDAGRMGAGI